MKDPYFSRAVEKAMLALEHIRRSPQPLSLAEASAVLGLRERRRSGCSIRSKHCTICAEQRTGAISL
jgi:hypothetical protein